MTHSIHTSVGILLTTLVLVAGCSLMSSPPPATPQAAVVEAVDAATALCQADLPNDPVVQALGTPVAVTNAVAEMCAYESIVKPYVDLVTSLAKTRTSRPNFADARARAIAAARQEGKL